MIINLNSGKLDVKKIEKANTRKKGGNSQLYKRSPNKDASFDKVLKKQLKK